MEVKSKYVYTIALVDDDVVCHKLMRHYLKMEGNTCLLNFYNGQEAFEYLMNPNQSILPNLLFLDINMPICNGWSFLRKFDLLESDIKERMKIFLMSSSISPSDLDQAEQERSVAKYITKPMGKQYLLNLINNERNT